MRLFVSAKLYHSTIDPERVNLVRGKFAEAVESLSKAGKLEAGGVYAGKRQAVLIVNAQDETEAFNLLAGLLDLAEAEIVPLASFETLAAYFAESPAI